ncbi:MULTISPECIES: DUF4397 domain-containing protein [Niastella]|uniref:DUF4397 domain-containing protein n=1 Tax=Niastella TaxID=354354 RepID=UPI001ADBA817|nr:DUF4397 domain-containing protein [Niastella soli]
MQVRKNAFLMLGILAFVAVAMSGCLKEAKTSAPTPKTYISLMHLAPWGPPVEVYFDNTKASSAINAGTVASSYSALDPGIFAISFKKGGGDSLVASIPAALYDSSKYFTLLLYNYDSTHVAATRITDDYSQLTSDRSFFRFFHMAPEIGDVDVYFDNTMVSSTRSFADNVSVDYYNQFTGVTPSNYTVSVKKSGTDSVIAQSTSTFPLTQFNAFTIYLRGKKSGTGINAIGIDYLQSVD